MIYYGQDTKRFENIILSFILNFTSLQTSVGTRAVAFYHDGSCGSWFGQVFTVLASDSFSLFQLNSFLYVSQIIYD